MIIFTNYLWVIPKTEERVITNRVSLILILKSLEIYPWYKMDKTEYGVQDF